jgi:hypothetical protein
MGARGSAQMRAWVVAARSAPGMCDSTDEKISDGSVSSERAMRILARNAGKGRDRRDPTCRRRHSADSSQLWWLCCHPCRHSALAFRNFLTTRVEIELAKRIDPTGCSSMSFFSKKPEPKFPPESWSKPADQPEVAAAARVSLPETPAHERELEIPGKATATTAVSTEAPVQASLIEDAPDGATASSTLAMRIRDLIPSKLLDGKATPPLPPPPVSSDEPPAHPAPPAWLDTQVARLLESAEVMNGTITQGRKSVWDTLERIRAPKSSTKSGSSAAEKGKGKAEAPGEDSDSDDDDDSSVMLYAPLIPNNDSKLELAEREIVRTDAEGRIVSIVRDEPAHAMQEAGDKSADSEEGAQLERSSSWWPFKKQSTAKSSTQPVAPTHATSAETTTTEAPPKETLTEGLKRQISQKVPLAAAEDMVEGLKRKVTQKVTQTMHERAIWVPSPTQISFQANWWGYRMYATLLSPSSIPSLMTLALATFRLRYSGSWTTSRSRRARRLRC